MQLRARFASTGANASVGNANVGKTTRDNFAKEKRTAIFVRRWETRGFKILFEINYLDYTCIS